MVLDNVDQHSYGSDKYQERTQLVANNLMASLRAVTILTLREESFFRSTMSGVLDASIPSVFYIPFASFEELVRSRIDYVLKLLKLPADELESVVGGTAGIGANRQMLSTYFEIIKNSLRSERYFGREILRFIDEVSGGDMRAALRFFSAFLVSGNTDVSEMLTLDEINRKKNESGYIIPFHHVIKSIILEDSRLYSGSQSRIMNLFDLNSAYTNSHFTHLRILNYLNGRLGYSTTHGRGYVEIDELLQKADEISINQGAIEDSLKKMALFGLIEFENQSKEGFDKAVYTRITNMGMYYQKELANMFPYLDLMWMDTPISDPDVVSKLLQHVVELRPFKTSMDLDDRFFRTEVFLDYLEDAEEDEFSNNPELDDSPLTKRRFMKAIRESYEQQKEYIISRRTWNFPEQKDESDLSS